jgi:hypothetical protein
METTMTASHTYEENETARASVVLCGLTAHPGPSRSTPLESALSGSSARFVYLVAEANTVALYELQDDFLTRGLGRVLVSFPRSQLESIKLVDAPAGPALEIRFRDGTRLDGGIPRSQLARARQVLRDMQRAAEAG